MTERVRALIDEAGESTLPQRIDAARDKAVELGELTREEADKVASYLKRDIEDAATYLSGPSQEFADWLRFDIQLIEERLLEMFLTVADQTKLELMKLQHEADRADAWHTGEIAGIGTLQCFDCGELLHFHATGHIPPCPKCHGTAFRRVASND
jgi:Zn finger protein HypA/HybF involved in hydrogenase expression